jgi:hypothetical protein
VAFHRQLLLGQIAGYVALVEEEAFQMPSSARRRRAELGECFLGCSLRCSRAWRWKFQARAGTTSFAFGWQGRHPTCKQATHTTATSTTSTTTTTSSTSTTTTATACLCEDGAGFVDSCRLLQLRSFWICDNKFPLSPIWEGSDKYPPRSKTTEQSKPRTPTRHLRHFIRGSLSALWISDRKSDERTPLPS